MKLCFFLVLFAVSWIYTEADEYQTVTIQPGEEDKLSCPNGQTLRIKSAEYQPKPKGPFDFLGEAVSPCKSNVLIDYILLCYGKTNCLLKTGLEAVGDALADTANSASSMLFGSMAPKITLPKCTDQPLGVQYKCSAEPPKKNVRESLRQHTVLTDELLH